MPIFEHRSGLYRHKSYGVSEPLLVFFQRRVSPFHARSLVPFNPTPANRANLAMKQHGLSRSTGGSRWSGHVEKFRCVAPATVARSSTISRATANYLKARPAIIPLVHGPRENWGIGTILLFVESAFPPFPFFRRGNGHFSHFHTKPSTMRIGLFRNTGARDVRPPTIVMLAKELNQKCRVRAGQGLTGEPAQGFELNTGSRTWKISGLKGFRLSRKTLSGTGKACPSQFSLSLFAAVRSP